MKREIVYSTVVLMLIVYLFSTCLYMFDDLCPRAELPLTQAEAQRIGGKMLRISYPHIFRKKVGGHKLDMTLQADDQTDVWEVYYYHKPHMVRTKEGREYWSYYRPVYVNLDKATGKVVQIGHYSL